MPRRSRRDEVDAAVEAMLHGQQPDTPSVNAELSDLLTVAAALRAMPRTAFRRKLFDDLRPPLVPHDLREVAKDLPALENRRLATMDRSSIGLFRFSGSAPWERHPDGDELILVLDGGGDITVLTENGPVAAELRPGRLFVCPRGLWHRPVATPSMTALYITPLTGSEHSWADDPRVG